jgi:hypothetical protein
MKNNEVENHSKERRFARRFESKELLVHIRYLKKMNWFNRFIGPFIIDDIAISSIRFQCPKNFLATSQVELRMTLKGLDSIIFVKGKIIGKKADLFENIFEYIVQFSPFGKGLKYNSEESKELLDFFLGSIQSEDDIESIQSEDDIE